MTVFGHQSRYLPLLSTWWVFFLLLSMGAPCTSTQTWGSTMEVGFSHSGLGSCWAEITWNNNNSASFVYSLFPERSKKNLTLMKWQSCGPHFFHVSYLDSRCSQLQLPENKHSTNFATRCDTFWHIFKTVLPEQWAGQAHGQDLHQHSQGWRWCQVGTWREASGRNRTDHYPGTCHDLGPSAHQVSGSSEQLKKTQNTAMLMLSTTILATTLKAKASHVMLFDEVPWNSSVEKGLVIDDFLLK